MARTRIIKPAFFTNEDLADVSIAARLYFIGLWCQADREGVIEYRPRRLKVEIFPHDPESAVKIHELTVELHGKKLVQMMQHGDTRYIVIPTFSKHQRPHPDEKASEHPQVSEMTMVYPNTVKSHGKPLENTASCASYPSPSYPSPSSLLPSPLSPATPEVLPEEDPTSAGHPPDKENGCAIFPKFWDAWPTHERKADKKKCLAFWKANKLDEVSDRIGFSLKAWKRSASWAEKDGQFIPAPIVWLRARKWEAADPKPDETRNPPRVIESPLDHLGRPI